MRRAILVALVLASAAPARAGALPSPDAPLPPAREVDLLIVVDTAPFSAALRAQVVQGLPAFADALTSQFYPDAPLDLHVGVVTSDRADGGALRTASADCAAAPTGTFVAYAGAAPTNATGSLADAIACLFPPADAIGADIAQPIDAAHVALDGSVAGNAGFRRPEAALAILFVAAQDDCSHDGAPLDRFGCATAGWACTPALDVTVGARTCTAASPSTVLVDPYGETGLYAALASSYERVAVGVITGDPSNVTVVSGPAIAPTCTDGEKIVGPAPRLHALVAGVLYGWSGDACASALDYSPFAASIGNASQPIVEYPPDDYDCDGGVGDPAGGSPGKDEIKIGCFCGSGAPTHGTLLVFAIAALVAFRRSSPSRRYRG